MTLNLHLIIYYPSVHFNIITSNKNNNIIVAALLNAVTEKYFHFNSLCLLMFFVGGSFAVLVYSQLTSSAVGLALLHSNVTARLKNGK